MEKEPDIRESLRRAEERAKRGEGKVTFGIEKVYSNGEKHFENITFDTRREAYNFIMDDFIAEALNKAYDELSVADFTWLCIKVVVRVAEYLQR